MSGIQKKQKQKQKQKRKRVVVTVAQKEAMLRGIQAAEFANNMVRRKHTRKHKNLTNLGNQSQSDGVLGLSSANRSTGRLKQVIEEDEYIADINGSVAFSCTSYSVNIGQSTTFPWGCKIAALFEKYHFNYLEFYYRREVSEYATNGQSGKIMLSFDYDASDAPPASKQQVLDTIPHADAMPCERTLKLVVNTNEMKSQDGWYIRPGLQPVNTDIKTYDCGVLNVSTYGCANDTAIGELRVRYKCTLHVPVLENNGGAPNQPGSYFEITSALVGETGGATGVSTAMFAATTSPSVLANSIQATLATSGLITLQPGVYKIDACAMVTVSTSSPSSLTLRLCQSATSNTGVVSSDSSTYNGGATVVNTATQAYTGYYNGMPTTIWNTEFWGTTVALQAYASYTSGVSDLNGYLRITTL